ncbi:MAG TPA: energy transducer TonB [Bryobacteraceae bacterium]|nr:energy transducer TonB [Bryobacteraceae bacterium]
MSRLRVRIELNRRMAGVPLDKMASVIEETRKFFHLLSEDVQMETDRGEWMASDFDPESLNFTAEYSGHVSADHVRAFGAAFSGATSLRKVTIAQFTRIAEFLGEDELVGFGLFQSDLETEPSEWRCLSKRDALRFGEEIKLLAEAAGEQAPETQLPAVMNASVAGRRLFKDRREEVRREREALAVDPSKLLREMESNLSRRIGLLEGEIAEQNKKMQHMRGGYDLAEERFQKLLSAMENFWAQAPRQLPMLAAPAQIEAPAPVETNPVEAKAVEAKPVEAKAPEALPVTSAPAVVAPAPAAPPETQSAPPEAPKLLIEPVVPERQRGWSILGVGIAAGLAVLAGVAFPEVQTQWSRFSVVETLPIFRPKAPAPPTLSTIARSSNVAEREVAVVKPVAERSSEPFVGPLIPIEIPDPLKPKIQSEVRVDVIVAIDPEGKVTGAHVASTRGASADLLVTEALRAAKQSRFRPAREGARTVQSRMLLTFLFEPI